VQNRCINRPTHLELINVPFPGFTNDFVQTFPVRRKDVESKKERKQEKKKEKEQEEIFTYEHALK